MLHGKEGRRSPRRDADLAISVLDVTVGRFDRDTEFARELLRLRSPRQHGNHLGFALGKSGWTFQPRWRLTGAFHHGHDGIRVEPTVLRFSRDGLCRSFRRHRFAVGAGFRHGVIGIGRGQQPRRKR
jgi:hypothetical protein